MMTPVITAANGPLWPKSVVIVITPDGCQSLIVDDHTAIAGVHPDCTTGTWWRRNIDRAQ